MSITEEQAILDSFQSRLGVRFRRPELLREALTHSSYVNERPSQPISDNERLEFLGDAVLGLVIADELFHRYPTAREGALTAMRAAIVRTDSLAQASMRIDLGAHLFLGRGEEASGGRQRAANLCAAFEAVVGALYLDQGLEQARALLLRVLGDAIQSLAATGPRDAKSLLQEQVQARLHLTPAYRTVAETGPDHAKEFVVEVWVGGRVLGRGVGPSKQAAEQAAAQSALASPALQGDNPGPAIAEPPQGS